MSDELEDLTRRLVVGRKSDGRGVYDEAAKAELVAACGRPGASVSRLARECGINANQLSRWVREHSERRQRAVVASPGTAREAFIAMPITAALTPTTPPLPATDDSRHVVRMNLQARLPNGVVFDLREVDVQQAGVVIEALGRVRCSVSTKA
ncbi:transposase [Methylibium sp.]|uniref:IS66-like element accessory protein TnpA n=1 Tax=Methylibium sp. TaxID=2067992 RepID=UPI0017F09044|nr:transposase [Methylibium sp.]MBA3588228.1 transposase [Methylibium sp.]